MVSNEESPSEKQTDGDAAPAARPLSKAEALAHQVESLARIGVTDADIALCVQLRPSELRYRFGRRLKRWRAQRRAMIRKRQMDQSSKSPAVLTSLVRDEFGNPDVAKLEGIADNDGSGKPEPRLDEKMG